MKYVCDRKRHLICVPYSVAGLHAMANNLGINRCWFHKPNAAMRLAHYDIPKLRIREIMAKCEVVDTREIVKIILGRNG